jgi:hypothetical protein
MWIIFRDIPNRMEDQQHRTQEVFFVFLFQAIIVIMEVKVVASAEKLDHSRSISELMGIKQL